MFFIDENKNDCPFVRIRCDEKIICQINCTTSEHFCKEEQKVANECAHEYNLAVISNHL